MATTKTKATASRATTTTATNPYLEGGFAPVRVSAPIWTCR